MGFEPQKFFIGVIDFFSILMPGALLAYLGKDWVAVKFCMFNNFLLTGTEEGIVFLFASYLLGHITFLLGAKLDDLIYQPLRDCTDMGQIYKRLAGGKGLSARWQRRFAASSYLFGKKADTAVRQVERIKARALHELGSEDAINAFQWSKAWLAKDFPAGLVSVQRFEADSKFFRSFVVVLGVLTVFYACRCIWLAAAVSFIGIVPALWRYINQRFKSTQQAYWLAITTAKSPGPRILRDDGLTHAGGIVYKHEGEIVKFLLVQASNNRSQWVLPKGHIEPGEPPRITAVREMNEETGHWAKIIRWIEDSKLPTETNAPMVRWFLMELAEAEKEFAEAEKEWPEENRQSVWVPLAEAMSRASFPETRQLLEKAGKYSRP